MRAATFIVKPDRSVSVSVAFDGGKSCSCKSGKGRHTTPTSDNAASNAAVGNSLIGKNISTGKVHPEGQKNTVHKACYNCGSLGTAFSWECNWGIALHGPDNVHAPTTKLCCTSERMTPGFDFNEEICTQAMTATELNKTGPFGTSWLKAGCIACTCQSEVISQHACAISWLQMRAHAVNDILSHNPDASNTSHIAVATEPVLLSM